MADIMTGAALMPTLASYDIAMMKVKAAAPEATKAAAKDFEAVFISQMMSHMFEGVKTDPMFGGGEGEEMFRSMLVQEYGKQMAQGQGIGISDQMQKMMLQMQQQ